MKKIGSVLLIDDDKATNFLNASILKSTNLVENIKVADSAIDALELLKNHTEQPDLILLDINMPEMNGWEFLEAYKMLDKMDKAQVIIIMLTTSLNPSDREKADTIPEIDGFERKPLNPKALEDLIQNHF